MPIVALPKRWPVLAALVIACACASVPAPPPEPPKPPPPPPPALASDEAVAAAVDALRRENSREIQGCYEAYLGRVAALVGDDPTPRPPPKPVDGTLVAAITVGVDGSLSFEAPAKDDFADPDLLACVGRAWRTSALRVRPAEALTLEIPYTFESGWAQVPVPPASR